MDDRTPGYDDPDFGDVLRDRAPLTIAEWDALLASEQAQTAEPYDPQP